MKIVLASTSPYRNETLTELGLCFTAHKPNVIESALKAQNRHLAPKELCQFLAFKKAESCHQFNNITIGSDQLLSLDGVIFDKPSSVEMAHRHLRTLSGKTHQLITSLCVLYKDKVFESVVIANMKMLPLSEEQIQAYLRLDEPYDCVGAYKIEKCGLWLFDQIQTEDWFAIKGIPVLSLLETLRKLQIDGLTDRGQR
jgi:septum formation protein